MRHYFATSLYLSVLSYNVWRNIHNVRESVIDISLLHPCQCWIQVGCFFSHSWLLHILVSRSLGKVESILTVYTAHMSGMQLLWQSPYQSLTTELAYPRCTIVVVLPFPASDQTHCGQALQDQDYLLLCICVKSLFNPVICNHFSLLHR